MKKSSSKYKNKSQRGDRNGDRRQKSGQSRHHNSDQVKQRANLYGLHAVKAAWLNPDRKVQGLYGVSHVLEGFVDVIAQAERMGLDRPAPTYLDKHQLEKMVPKDSVHQGVALAVSDLPEYNARDLMIAGMNRPKSCVVILDQVTDPHNVGAIVRSACAFGATGLVVQSKHAPQFDGVLAKAASGALEHLKIAYEINLSRSIKAFQEEGYFVYGLDERGEDIRDFKPADKCVFVMGAEGAGMRRLIAEHCDTHLRIPMQEGTVESLNVSNAAAVALYALLS